jgi:hypothetical protein
MTCPTTCTYTQPWYAFIAAPPRSQDYMHLFHRPLHLCMTVTWTHATHAYASAHTPASRMSPICLMPVCLKNDRPGTHRSLYTPHPQVRPRYTREHLVCTYVQLACTLGRLTRGTCAHGSPGLLSFREGTIYRGRQPAQLAKHGSHASRAPRHREGVMSGDCLFFLLFLFLLFPFLLSPCLFFLSIISYFYIVPSSWPAYVI